MPQGRATCRYQQPEPVYKSSSTRQVISQERESGVWRLTWRRWTGGQYQPECGDMPPADMLDGAHRMPFCETSHCCQARCVTHSHPKRHAAQHNRQEMGRAEGQGLPEGLSVHMCPLGPHPKSSAKCSLGSRHIQPLANVVTDWHAAHTGSDNIFRLSQAVSAASNGSGRPTGHHGGQQKAAGGGNCRRRWGAECGWHQATHDSLGWTCNN